LLTFLDRKRGTSIRIGITTGVTLLIRIPSL